MFSAVCCCRLLEELLVSLQWGREQTYYPSGQPHSTAELALTNHKLAKAVNSHLLGNVGTNGQKKVPSTVEFCSTPAEKMAETVKYFSFMTCITSKTVLLHIIMKSTWHWELENTESKLDSHANELVDLGENYFLL